MTKQRALSILLGGLALATAGAAAFVLYHERAPRSGPRRVMPGEELSRTPGVSIRRGLSGFGSWHSTPTSIEARGYTLRDFLQHAFTVPRGGLRVEIVLPEGYYDIVVSEMTDNAQHYRQRLAPVLAEAFGIVILTERRPVESLRLRFDPETGEPFPAASPARGPRRQFGPGAGEQGLRLKLRGTWEDLAKDLTEAVATPVIAPRGAAGTFDFDLEWNPRDPDSLTRALAARGVTLEPSVEELEVLVVKPR